MLAIGSLMLGTIEGNTWLIVGLGPKLPALVGGPSVLVTPSLVLGDVFPGSVEGKGKLKLGMGVKNVSVLKIGMLMLGTIEGITWLIVGLAALVGRLSVLVISSLALGDGLPEFVEGKGKPKLGMGVKNVSVLKIGMLMLGKSDGTTWLIVGLGPKIPALVGRLSVLVIPSPVLGDVLPGLIEGGGKLRLGVDVLNNDSMLENILSIGWLRGGSSDPEGRADGSDTVMVLADKVRVVGCMVGRGSKMGGICVSELESVAVDVSDVPEGLGVGSVVGKGSKMGGSCMSELDSVAVNVLDVPEGLDVGSVVGKGSKMGGSCVSELDSVVVDVFDADVGRADT